MSDALSTTIALNGLAGLLSLTGHSLVRATEYIIDKEDYNHDDDRLQEEGRSVQFLL